MGKFHSDYWKVFYCRIYFKNIFFNTFLCICTRKALKSNFVHFCNIICHGSPGFTNEASRIAFNAKYRQNWKELLLEVRATSLQKDCSYLFWSLCVNHMLWGCTCMVSCQDVYVIFDMDMD